MTIDFAPKKIVLGVCVVAVLIVGGALYVKQARDAETSAYITRAGDSGAAESANGSEGDADGASANEAEGEEAAAPADAQIYVDVAGAVKKPGVVSMDAGSRVFQAIAEAGGETKDADTRAINLAAALNDGEHIYVPTKEEAAAGNYPQGSAANSAGDSAAASPANGKININTADSAALQQLNGVGPVTARKIIDYRNSNGKFKTIEDLKNVSGIGDKTFAKLKDYICV
jgi:competence protein ComEA